MGGPKWNHPDINIEEEKGTDIHPEPIIWGNIPCDGISKTFRNDNFGTHKRHS